MQRRSPPRAVAFAIAAALVVTILGGRLAVGAAGSPTTTGASGATAVTRTPLAEAVPANSPGNVLYLQRVRIEPGARLAEHFHEGTQVASVVSGTLTYDVVSGTVAVTRKDGASQTVRAPARVRLRAGDSLVETEELVHYGSNRGRHPVEILLGALLRDGAPLATPVGQARAGERLDLAADLASESRVLHETTAGVYGWNRLVGTAELAGAPVAVEMLGSVAYTGGSGPFSGFVTFTFADGSTLATQMAGSARASADTTDATFTSTLGVLGGTGRYAGASGAGAFTGTRTAALGTTVAATFVLTVTTA